MAGAFTVYKDKDGKFRFRLKAGNNRTVATGSVYATAQEAKDACELVKVSAAGATLEEVTA